MTPLLHGMVGLFQVGYGTQSKGMGGVGIALPQDTLVVARNPAGMALLCNRFDVGLDWVGIDGDFIIRNSTDEEANRNYRSRTRTVFPELGANYMVMCDMSVGLSFYKPGFVDTNYGRSIPTIGTSRLHFCNQLYTLAPSWSWAVNDCHSIGIALNVTYGRLRLGGLQTLATDQLSRFPSDLTNRGSETEWGIGAHVGWLGHFMDIFSVGFHYQTRTWMSSYNKYRGFFPKNGQLDLPAILGGGIAMHLCPPLVLSLDLDYIFWRDIPGWGNKTRTDNLYGSQDGPGLGWDDTLNLRIGAAYDIWRCLTLRVGYSFNQSPIDSNDVNINFLTLATIEHHFTVGASYSWGWNELSFAYIHGISSHRSGILTPNFPGRGKIGSDQNQVSLSYGRIF